MKMLSLSRRRISLKLCTILLMVQNVISIPISEVSPNQPLKVPCSSINTSDSNKIVIFVETYKNSNKTEEVPKLQNNSSSYPWYEISGISEGFQVRCQSRSPLQMKFDGILANQVQVITSRYSEVGSRDQCYEVRVRLNPRQSATGRYSCVSSNTNETTEGSAFVYIFAKDKSSPYILQTEIKPVVTAQRNKEEKLVLPCRTSNPSLTLLRLFQEGTELTNKDGVDFDPTVGFILTTNCSRDLTYTCHEEYNSSSKRNKTLEVDLKCLDPETEDHKPIQFKLKVESGNKFRYECIGAKSMSYGKCKDPTECEFLNGCATTATSESDFCTRGKICPNSDHDFCRSTLLLPDTFNGVIFCSDERETVIKEIFTDLKGQRFDLQGNTGFKEATSNATLIDWIPTEYGTWENVDDFRFNEHVDFQCNVSKSVGSEGIRFAFQLYNGSIVPATIQTENTTEYDTVYSKTAEIIFSEMEIVRLICLAPTSYSSEWYNLSTPVNMQASTAPIMENPGNETIRLTSGFGVHDSTELSCSAYGTQLIFSWTRNGVPIDNLHHMSTDHFRNKTISRISLGYDSKATVFNESDPTRSDYTCTVNNHLGSVAKHFTVRWDKFPVLVVLASCVGFILLSCLLMSLVYIVWSRYRQKYPTFPQKDVERFFNGNYVPDKVNKYKHLENNTVSQFPNVTPQNNYLDAPYMKEKEIKDPDKNLIMGQVSGSGQFGIVYRAKLLTKSGELCVAVKTLKQGASEDDFNDLLKEIKVLQYVGEHENVVKFVGGVTTNIRRRQVKIVVEYCLFNDLKDYLSERKGSFQNAFQEPPKNGYTQFAVLTKPTPAPVGNYSQLQVPVTTSDLFNWSQQIASGMEYLANKGVVHRDLAARNVLLSENYICKITDFGLSKNLYNSEKAYYVPQPKDNPVVLPWRWLSVEAFPTLETSSRFSTDSDIWAFGVTMWEIFSLGDEPYPEHPNNLLNALPDALRSGYRMSKPRYANDAMYEIIQSCWRSEGSARPRFSTLKNTITYAKNAGSVGGFNMANFNTNNNYVPHYFEDMEGVGNDAFVQNSQNGPVLA